MATVTDLSGLAPTEVRGFDRQRRMAQALTDQSMKPVTGQMVGQHYVANPWGNIANVFSAYQGKQMGERVDREEAEAMEKARQRNAQLMGQALRIYRGYEEDRDVNATPMDDEGNVMPAATQRVKVAGDKDRALALLSGSTSPQAQQIANKILEQQFKEPKWEKAELPQMDGTTKVGWVDINSPNPEATFRQGGVNPGISLAERARLADEGIGIPGGAPSFVNQGGSGGQGATLPPTAQAPGAPSAQTNTAGQKTGAPAPVSQSGDSPSAPPPYVYDPNLSPKQNREAKAKIHTAWTEERAKNVKNAQDSYGVIRAANELLSSGAPSSGRASNIITGIGEFFGASSDASKADAQLKVLGSKLTMQVPRFEGPQSDKDTALYQAAAADIGNPNIPVGTRREALKTLVSLHQKYAPDKKWGEIFPDAVDNQNPLLGGKVSLGPAGRR